MKPRGLYEIAAKDNPATGSTAYTLAGTTKSGERIRRQFPNYEAALAVKQQLEQSDAGLKFDSGLRNTRLSESEILDAERALADLRAHPGFASKTLCDAVAFFLKRHVPTDTAQPLRLAVEKFLEEWKRDGSSPRHLGSLTSRAGFLVKWFGDTPVAEITADDLRALLHARRSEGVSVETLRNDRRGWGTFFQFAADKGWAKSNPCRDIQPKKELKKNHKAEPVALTVAESRALMEAAAGYKGGRLVPNIALGLFCGLRPDEAKAMNWAKVNLKTRLITIRSSDSKVRQARTVEIPQTAVEWLAPHAAKRAPIYPKNWRRDFDAIRAVIGYGTKATQEALNKGKPQSERVELKPWPQDVLRHTAISYRVYSKEGGGKERVADWAGTSTEMINRHYLSLVTDPDDVPAFYAITPQTVTAGNIVPLTAAG